MLRTLYIICLLLVSTELSAQKSIRIKVLDQNDNNIEGGTVLLKEGEKILAFSHDEKNGLFNISLNKTTAKNLILEFNHISFVKATAHYEEGKSDYTIKTMQKSRIIETIVGKALPLRQKGDTLVYQVNAFADSIDRSIGEVISKMPGFEVSQAGKISYNGQDISSFMIDGDDLLGQKYSLGTQNIDPEIISYIEVYRNHQPVKALENRVPSNDVAINLKVKEASKSQWIGRVEVGSGLPRQYLAELNTLQFKEGFKTLNALQYNNIGKDVKSGILDLIEDPEESDPAQPYLSNGLNDVNSLPYTFYFKNNGLAALSNLFLNLPKDWSMRLNLGVYGDKNKLQSNFIQDYLLSDQHLNYQEKADLVFKPIDVDLRAKFLKNIKQNYLSNELSFNYSRNSTVNDAMAGTLNVNEDLRQKNVTLINDLSYIPNHKGKNLWQLNWKTTFRNIPEKLGLKPSSTLPVLVPFDLTGAAMQRIKNHKFRSALSAKLHLKPWKSIQQSYGANMLIEKESLNSGLTITSDNQTAEPNDFQNNLDWTRLAANIVPNYFYDKGNLQINLSLPFGIQRIAYNDIVNTTDSRKNSLLFLPQLDLKYAPFANHSVRAKIWADQRFGQISDIYTSYILKNFRSVERSFSELPTSKLRNILATYFIEIPQKMLFINFSYRLSIENRNVIASTEVTDATEEHTYLNDDNTITSNQFSTKISKYLGLLKASSSIELSYRNHKSTQIFNGNNNIFEIKTYDIKPSIRGKIGPLLWRYSGLFQKNRGKQELSSETDHGDLINHNVSLSYTYRTRLFLTIAGNQVRLTNTSNNISSNSLNASIRLKGRKKFEYELMANNLLDENEFSLYNMAEGISSTQNYRLRGRIILLKTSWSF